MRTGIAEPLRRPVHRSIDESIRDDGLVAQNELEDLDIEADDFVIAPAVERPPPEPLSIAMHIERDKAPEPRDETAPIARNVSLGSLMLLTMLIAVCLAVGRASTWLGIVAFLLLVPAHIRTLSAISYYRRRERKLGREDIAAIFATSLVLSVMGLFAGGLVLWFVASIVQAMIASAGGANAGIVPTFIGAGAAFITMLVLIHKVWPVNEE